MTLKLKYILFMILLPCILLADSSGSLFSPKIFWKNESGETVQLSQFRGNWVVMSMMYTSCQGSCPLIIKKMRKINDLFRKNEKKSEFVLITFDPTRDTSEKLKKYRAQVGIDEPNWHFWNGSETDTRKLSMLLGMKYAKDPESGEFMHDNQIFLISPDGKVVQKLSQLSEDENELLAALLKWKQ